MQHDIKEIQQKLELKDNNLVQQQQLETQLEHLYKTLEKYERLRMIRLDIEQESTIVKVYQSSSGGTQIQFTVVMTQFSLNLNNATTGHNNTMISKQEPSSNV